MIRILIMLIALSTCKGKETEIIQRAPNNPPSSTVNNFPPPDGFPPVQRDPTFLRFDNIEQFALNSLQSADVDAEERANSRFIVLSDKFNEGTRPQDMASYRAAVNKALNSLSLEREIEVAQGVDSTQTILRFDQTDFGFTSSNQKWRAVEISALFKIKSQTQRGALIRQLTDTDYPIIHAHNFIEAAMLNGAYYFIVETPILLGDFYASQDVDLQDLFDTVDRDLFMLGITRSGIARGKSRVFLGIESRFGSMWTTYDTDIANNVRNVASQFPFPVEARTAKTFNHDAQEFIYELENGCHGYALFNAAGVRENFAPTSIVFNDDSGGIDPEIRNARVCLQCHAGGFIPKTDEINAKVQTDPNFNGDERQKAARFFGRVEDLADRFADDNNRYREKCLSEFGVRSGDPEPVNQLTDTFNREWDLNTTASFFFLPEQEFADGLRASDAFALIGQLLEGSSVNKNDVQAAQADLEEDLNLFRDPFGQ